MKYTVLSIATLTASILLAAGASAQNAGNQKYSLKASADIGLGDALSTGDSRLDMNTKSSASDFGVDFGWTFWQKNKNSLELNVGLGYGTTSLTAEASAFNYSYNAPAAADMDNETYIRCYSVEAIHQKITSGRVALPIYLDYRYQINQRVSIHGLLGFKLGFNLSSKVDKTSGSAFSYGIYPQYDDLMIDATYMNAFGKADLSTLTAEKPQLNSLTASILAGVGAECHIWGPLSAEATVRYEKAFNNLFKDSPKAITSFDAENAPITYTVAGGQKIAPLSSYITDSKLSRLSLCISLLYRF